MAKSGGTEIHGDDLAGAQSTSRFCYGYCLKYPVPYRQQSRHLSSATDDKEETFSTQDAKEEFQFMLERGVCRPSKNPWSSPQHLVLNKDGYWRPCGGYRRLNALTIPDRYLISFLQDCTHNPCGVYHHRFIMDVPPDSGNAAQMFQSFIHRKTAEMD